jgi:hypothetical protein
MAIGSLLKSYTSYIRHDTRIWAYLKGTKEIGNFNIGGPVNQLIKKALLAKNLKLTMFVCK